MKTTDVRLGLVLALTVVLSTVPDAAQALHSAGADCLDCHRMHLSLGGSPDRAAPDFVHVARRQRLKALDPSAASAASRRAARSATSPASPVVTPPPAVPGAASVSSE